MKILLADDHPLFLEGLQNLLAAHGVQVVGTATDGMDALAKALIERPDVILMDIMMPVCSGITATSLIKAQMPDVKIIMLTTSEDDESLFEAIKSGASGYLLKNLRSADLFEMLASLERGDAPLSPGLASRILREFKGEKRESSVELTQVQIKVLTMVTQGMDYRETANALGLNEKGVAGEMEEALRKLRLIHQDQAEIHERRDE